MIRLGRPLWFVILLKQLYKQRKFAALITNMPLIGPMIVKYMFSGDTLVCLTKDTVIPINHSLEPQIETILPSHVAEYFVEEANYHWIMDFCICRSSNHCRDYPSELGCLFLGKAAMQINPKIGHKASKEEALEHLRKCREAGLIHFIGKVKGDELWLGASPGNQLLTICNCCPCCCIAGLIKYMSPIIAKHYRKLPGVEITVTDRCVGCGTCVKTCFVNAIHLINKHAVIGEMCRGCGRCVEICPKKAITLTLNDSQFIQKTIDHISKYVNLT